MMTLDPLSNRAVSAFPISVATSLAMESFFKGPNPCIDPERVPPQKIEIAKYNEFYINLSTLVRNIITSLSKEDYLKVGPRGISQTLAFEMEMIESIFRSEANSPIKIIFYACEYKDALSKFSHPHAIFRTETTDKQKEYRNIHEGSIKLFLKHNQGSENLKIFDSKIKPNSTPKALILTHIPYDLLSYKNFDNLELIESHTGVLKNKSQWYTKYHEGKTLNTIPFNCGFLQFFGDSEFYKPFGIAARRLIVNLANENHWTQVTKMEKLKYDIGSLKDIYLREVLLSMLRES